MAYRKARKRRSYSAGRRSYKKFDLFSKIPMPLMIIAGGLLLYKFVPAVKTQIDKLLTKLKPA